MKPVRIACAIIVVLGLIGCGEPVRIVEPISRGAVLVRVAGDPTPPPVVSEAPQVVSIEQRWTNECVEVPRLTGGPRTESELEWVRRIAAVAAERQEMRLVSVSYPLQHRGVDMALVCFSAPHEPTDGSEATAGGEIPARAGHQAGQ